MKKSMRDVRSIPWDGYPVTVTKDRYTGTYSEGEWIAFALDPSNIPEEPFEDDCTAGGYWWAGEIRDGDGSTIVLKKFDERHPRFVGRGSTAEDAIADLKRRRGPKAP